MILPIISQVMSSIITVDIKSFLFTKIVISDHQFGFRPDHSTLDMLLQLSQQWWRPSISDMRSGLSLWTYLELWIQSGILPCSPNCLPMESKANSTLGLLTSSTLGLLTSFTLVDNVWLSTEPFHLLSLSRSEYPQGSALGPNIIPNLHQ